MTYSGEEKTCFHSQNGRCSSLVLNPKPKGGKPVIKAYMFITSIAEAIVTTLYAHRLREKIFKASSGDLPDNSLHSHYHSEENLG